MAQPGMLQSADSQPADIMMPLHPAQSAGSQLAIAEPDDAQPPLQSVGSFLVTFAQLAANQPSTSQPARSRFVAYPYLR